MKKELAKTHTQELKELEAQHFKQLEAIKNEHNDVSCHIDFCSSKMKSIPR